MFYLIKSYIEQIRHFQERGVRIDGIGVQGHFSGHVHPEILKVISDIPKEFTPKCLFLLNEMLILFSLQDFIGLFSGAREKNPWDDRRTFITYNYLLNYPRN